MKINRYFGSPTFNPRNYGTHKIAHLYSALIDGFATILSSKKENTCVCKKYDASWSCACCSNFLLDHIKIHFASCWRQRSSVANLRLSCQKVYVQYFNTEKNEINLLNEGCSCINVKCQLLRDSFLKNWIFQVSPQSNGNFQTTVMVNKLVNQLLNMTVGSRYLFQENK